MQTLKADITKLHSVTEYAKLMKVSRQTVYNWIDEKKQGMKVHNISGKVFIEVN